MAKSFKPRLRRLEWLYTDCPIYYLTACTQDRRALLANARIHESFVAFAHRATDRHVLVGRYVIMPDHVHFFAAFSPASPALWAWMKSWKNALSKTLRQMKIPPRHWEKDYFDHVLRSAESYEQKWLYVRDNPVRAGLVKRWQDWPYQGEIHPLMVKKWRRTMSAAGGHRPPLQSSAVTDRPYRSKTWFTSFTALQRRGARSSRVHDHGEICPTSLPAS